MSQIDVSDAHDAVVLLDNDPALLHLGEERFRERLQAYLEIAETLRERIPDIDYVDLRFEQRVYVKPRGRAAGTACNWQPLARLSEGETWHAGNGTSSVWMSARRRSRPSSAR